MTLPDVTPSAVPAYDWIAQHARQLADRTALVDLHSGRRFTYAQLEDRTARLAHALQADLGVGPNDRVAVLANNSTNCLELQFACAKIGAVFVPLNWRLTVPELTFILTDCAPHVLVHEDVFADSANALRDACEITHLVEWQADGDSPYEGLIRDATPDFARVVRTHDDMQTIMYTSGTTGHPKGAIITHGMTFWNAINLTTPHRLFESMVNLCVLPLFHTGGLNCYANPAALWGGTTVVMRSFDPGAALECLRDQALGITHFLGVPANYLFMSQHPDFERTDFGGLTTCGVGGAPTPVELLKIYQGKGKGLQQGFGMTETSPIVSALTPDKTMDKVGSAGLTALHAESRLVDEDGNDVTTPDTVGELWVRGPNVTPGYWNRPDANESSFTDGWLHTGDAATIDSEGYIYIVDRWKDMYISGGENVYPAEVENVIYQLPEVGEVAIIGVPDERWGETGCAVIVVKEGQTLTEDTVLKHCREQLARFKQPATVRFVAEIPHNATGKVLKRELRDS